LSHASSPSQAADARRLAELHDSLCEQCGSRHHTTAEHQEKRLDKEILLVLLGGVLLVASVAALLLFENEEHSAILAAAASVLLGGPIVWGAAKGIWTGRCSHASHGRVGETRRHDERLDTKTDQHDDARPAEHARQADRADQAHRHDHVSGNHMEELVALAVLASFASGQFLECGAVAFFMLIASFIEHRTAAGALQTIESLIRITPTRARKLVSGPDGEQEQEQETDASSLQPGERVRVRPGDSVPADGVIRKGQSTLNQANLTGESLPVEKSEGDEVFSGTINETGVLEIEVTRAGADSTLGKVKDLITQAAASRPAVIRLLDRYAGYYTPVVVMLAVIVFLFTKDLNHSISLLLIACPCAIILAAPTAMVASLSAASRLGAYVKTVSDLEVARRVSAIVLDKTGTLTTGKLFVTRMKPAEGVDGEELLRTAASLEQNSNHPVAKAVIEVSERARVSPREVEDFEEASGRGVKGVIDGHTILAGRESFLREHGVDMSGIDLSEGEGFSLLLVARDGKAIGWIGLEDKVRSNAAEAMERLEKLGVKHRVMITGDRWSSANKVGRAMNVTHVEAEALPGDKLELVRDLKARGHTVLVVGDGVNDGPALAAGDVSIAMGAAGSDVAINSASIALMNSNLSRIPFLVHLSKRTVAVIRQNLVGVMVYILFMLFLLGFGYMTPLIAAIGHGISSIIVVFNSARLVREGEDVESRDSALPEHERAQTRTRPKLERVQPVAAPA